MRRPSTTAGRRRGAFALLAVLSLWLQLVVPVVGGTARLVAPDHPHASVHGDHRPHGDKPDPGRPGDGHGHLGLCCILNGKLGTGFGPPPPDSHPVRPFTPSAAAFASEPAFAADLQDRSVLPLGARAPPRFA
jgi:hypothetical protein